MSDWRTRNASVDPSKQAAVLVFCRSALQESSSLGLTAAAIEARKSLLRNVLEKVVGLDGVDVLLCYDGQVDHWLPGVRQYFAQVGHSFGERLGNAISKACRAGYERVVVIGSDVPHLRAEHICQAMRLLESNDLVLGPDAGGGCYLIGLRAGAESQLAGVRWQTGQDFDALASKPRVQVLGEVLSDVDSWDDLLTLDRRGLKRGLIRTLDAAAGIWTAEDAPVFSLNFESGFIGLETRDATLERGPPGLTLA